ncbi:MAG: ribose 5-phosphate isomerase B [Defluviitaleaceae bacterium]|nr:ribose 5-phosphate isomerase B [Defluviitaleaceae bacterium]MCL2240493.1 ribose 5-phosphate isomerase B [Defluviitaleaceae bacterium]
MKLAIGSDHAAPEMKQALISHLEGRGVAVVDTGAFPEDEGRFEYPVIGCRVGKLVAGGEVDGGVLVCGTGVGMSLAANKVRGVRACVCSEPFTARLSKEHNNANIIAVGARVVGIEMAKSIVDAWLDAQFMGGRHDRRVDMIMEIDSTGGLQDES